MAVNGVNGSNSTDVALGAASLVGGITGAVICLMATVKTAFDNADEIFRFRDGTEVRQ